MIQFPTGKPMTAELRRHIRQPSFGYGVLVDIDHPSGRTHLWSGTGTLDFDGKEWLGVGHVAAISDIEETSELVVSQVQSVLTNVPESELNVARADIKGRKQLVFWAGITPDRRVVPDPLLIAEIDLDFVTTATADDGTHTVALNGNTGFWVLERSSERAWTPEEQKIEFPGDTGFDLVAELVDKEVTWTID